jgi:hypothetical protein
MNLRIRSRNLRKYLLAWTLRQLFPNLLRADMGAQALQKVVNKLDAFTVRA